MNERWKPSSAQLRGKDYPTSTIAKCWHVGTQASAMASGLCLSSLAPPVPAPFSGAQTPSWKEGLLFPLAVAGESQGKTRLQCPVEPVMEATGNEIAHCLAWASGPPLGLGQSRNGGSSQQGCWTNTILCVKASRVSDSPWVTVDKNLPYDARDRGWIPSPGRFHMPQATKAWVPQLLSLCSSA